MAKAKQAGGTDGSGSSGGSGGSGSGTGLPPGIEAAWGLRERPTKGPARGLTVESIVAAATDIASSEGLAAVSMSRVASAVGVSTMALYRYVSSKDDLVVLMTDAAYGTPPDGPPPGEGWRRGIEHWARAQRAMLHGCLWTIHVPVTMPPATPNSVAWMERGLACLRGTGLDEGEKLGVLSLLGGYVRSEAVLMASLVEAARASGRTMEEATASYAHLLRRLTDPERFPAITSVLASGVLEPWRDAEGGAGQDSEPDPEQDPDGDFAFGLDRILDGVEALVRSRTGEGGDGDGDGEDGTRTRAPLTP
ncbi:TetR/AcrR family transcriptional regulator [Streptomyces sp. NPDC054796]